MFFVTPAVADRGGRGDGLPHGKWWNNTEVASQLKLSNNEVKSLDEMYTSHRRKIIKLRAVVESEQFELNNLIDSKTINDKAVLNQSKRLEQARSNLHFEQFKFFLDVRKLLGFDRYQQLKSMFQRMRSKRRYGQFKGKAGRKFHGNGKFNPSSMPYGPHPKKYGINDSINTSGTSDYSEPGNPSDVDNDGVIEEHL
jgi:hypothetical protein